MHVVACIGKTFAIVVALQLYWQCNNKTTNTFSNIKKLNLRINKGHSTNHTFEFDDFLGINESGNAIGTESLGNLAR
jgi:hypothetical protein